MKDYTKAADELAGKIADEWLITCTCDVCKEGNKRQIERVHKVIHSHTGSTLAELLAAKHQRDELKSALVELKSACVDVLLPTINEAIESGYKMSTWTPEQMQWAKAVEVTDKALAINQAMKEEQ